MVGHVLDGGARGDVMLRDLRGVSAADIETIPCGNGMGIGSVQILLACIDPVAGYRQPGDRRDIVFHADIGEVTRYAQRRVPPGSHRGSA